MTTHAIPGDWLVVERPNIDHHARRALIIEVRGTDGSPPYLVRWLDDDRETLVFPGPDAHVVTADEQVALDAQTGLRISALQRQLAEGK